VPWAELACSRVGDDGDVMVVQLTRPALRLLSGPAARTGCQLGCLHGVGNRSPTRRGEDVCVSGSRRVSWPTPQSGSGAAHTRRRLFVRDRELCEVESCRAVKTSQRGPSSRELVGGSPNWSVSGGETWTDPQGGYPSGCRLTNGGSRPKSVGGV
jgi:hypothetical protein